MPLHAFKCETCEHGWEKLMKHSDPDPTTCPACTAETIRRLMGKPIAKWQASDGVGGWSMNADGTGLQRSLAGNNSTRYGEGSV